MVLKVCSGWTGTGASSWTTEVDNTQVFAIGCCGDNDHAEGRNCWVKVGGKRVAYNNLGDTNWYFSGAQWLGVVEKAGTTVQVGTYGNSYFHGARVICALEEAN